MSTVLVCIATFVAAWIGVSFGSWLDIREQRRDLARRERESAAAFRAAMDAHRERIPKEYRR